MALFFYKEKNKDIRAAAYLRLSIEDGDKAESNSIGNQRELIRDFAAERPGLYLVEEYADDGYTGTNFERPGFKRMMEDIKSGKINCIVVKDLSRLGRNYIEMGKYLEQIFPMMGIRFIAINDNYDNIRRNGESNMIKDEEVAPYLSEAFSRYASGQKMRDIAKWLNEQGVEPPMRHKKKILGKPYDAESDQWTTDMLRCLFRNPTYTGAAANGSRQIIAENCHEPYITKEQFYAFPCNMREGENKISIRKSYKKPNPLAKHIVCTCGYALCWHKDKRTGEELFYCRYCRAHKENGKNLKVPAATIYKKVMDALELEHLEEEKLAAAIQQGAGKKAIEVVRAEKSVQMKSVLAELNMEQFRRVPLYESYIADEITEEQYRAELLDYEEAHRKLNEQLTTIMEDTLAWERALSLRNPWIQQMAQYKTPEELDRNFVKKYIEQVTVTLLENGQAKISLTMKTDEWKKMLGRIEMEGTDDGTKE